MDFINKFVDGQTSNNSNNNSQHAPSGDNMNNNNNNFNNSENFAGQQTGNLSGTQGGSTNAGGAGNFFSNLTGNLTNKFNDAAGGGRESEKNEDYLDKGVDFVQEKFLGQGAQDNETAMEQAKDEQISDFIRGKYKSMTGNDIPIKDKATTFDRNTD